MNAELGMTLKVEPRFSEWLDMWRDVRMSSKF